MIIERLEHARDRLHHPPHRTPTVDPVSASSPRIGFPFKRTALSEQRLSGSRSADAVRHDRLRARNSSRSMHSGALLNTVDPRGVKDAWSEGSERELVTIRGPQEDHPRGDRRHKRHDFGDRHHTL
jgi:hypothetical protein